MVVKRSSTRVRGRPRRCFLSSLPKRRTFLELVPSDPSMRRGGRPRMTVWIFRSAMISRIRGDGLGLADVDGFDGVGRDGELIGGRAIPMRGVAVVDG